MMSPQAKKTEKPKQDEFTPPGLNKWLAPDELVINTLCFLNLSQEFGL